MERLINISDAAVIAVHSMDYMFRHKKKTYSAKEISAKIKVSYNHLSKVLQRLAKANLIGTNRGPYGGYYLTKKGKKSTLEEIIRIIEGNKKTHACFLDSAVCGRNYCSMKNFLNRTYKEYKKLINLRLDNF